jgi:hypothetical protein
MFFYALAKRLRLRGIATRAVRSPMRRPLRTGTGVVATVPLMLIDLMTHQNFVGSAVFWLSREIEIEAISGTGLRSVSASMSR